MLEPDIDKLESILKADDLIRQKNIMKEIKNMISIHYFTNFIRKIITFCSNINLRLHRISLVLQTKMKMNAPSLLLYSKPVMSAFPSAGQILSTKATAPLTPSKKNWMTYPGISDKFRDGHGKAGSLRCLQGRHQSRMEDAPVGCCEISTVVIWLYGRLSHMAARRKFSTVLLAQLYDRLSYMAGHIAVIWPAI